MKQMSMKSFFRAKQPAAGGKAPPAFASHPKPAGAKPPSKAIKQAAKPGSAGGGSTSSPENPLSLMTPTSAVVVAVAAASDVGRAIKVWDEDEKRWQEGIVTAVKAKGEVTVEYTQEGDTEVEELNLNSRSLRFEWGDNSGSKSVSGGDSSISPGSRKRQQVPDDSGDEEAAFDSKEDEVADSNKQEGGQEVVNKKAKPSIKDNAAAQGKAGEKTRGKATATRTPAKKTIAEDSDDDDEEEAEFDDDDNDSDASEDAEEDEDEDDDDGGFLVDSDDDEDGGGGGKRKTLVKKTPVKKNAATASAARKPQKRPSSSPSSSTAKRAAVATPSSKSSSKKGASSSTPSSRSASSPFSSTPLSAKGKATATSPTSSPGSGGGGGGGGEGGSSTGSTGPKVIHKHRLLKWYTDPALIKDGRGVSQGQPGFNKRTLQLAGGGAAETKFLEDQTPAQAQWWDMKRKGGADLVFLFKIGKFYELYNADADVGVKEAGLTYMNSEVVPFTAHCGFPELAYGKCAEVLCSKGYRVARIEQCETVEQNKERSKTCPQHFSKVEKVLFKNTAREMCSVLSPGTRTYGYFDSMSNTETGDAVLKSALKECRYQPPTSTVLLAIKEVAVAPASASASASTSNGDDDEDDGATAGESSLPAVCEYGVCLVDSPTGSVMLGQFADDAQRTRLRTLLTQHPPAEVLLERDHVSEETSRIVKHMCSGALLDDLQRGSEFWSAAKTKRELLQEGVYFTSTNASIGVGGAASASASSASSSAASTPTPNWNAPPVPEVLAAVCGACDSGGGENDGSGGDDDDEGDEGDVGGGASLALSALGAASWVLRRALVDEEVLGMGRFHAYVPPDLEAALLLETEKTDEAAAAVQQAAAMADDGGDGGDGDEPPSPAPPSSGVGGGSLAALVAAQQASRQVNQQTSADSSAGDVSGFVTPECAQLSDLYWVATGQKLTASGGNVFSPQSAGGVSGGGGGPAVGSKMLLDGAALTNLEVLLSSDGCERGSLWAFLDNTSTCFGKRLLREWLVAPLFKPSEIEARLDAVEELAGPLSEVEALVKSKLKKLPDLEKLLLNVRSFGSLRRATSHPDSRARIYDADKLDKKKVLKLAELLTGMKCLKTLVASVAKDCCGNGATPPSSTLLSALLFRDSVPAGEEGQAVHVEGGLFPFELGEALAWFDQHVDLAAAKRTGTIEPKEGMDADFDAAVQEESEVRARLEAVLKEEQKGSGLEGSGRGSLKGSGVKWWHHKTKLEDMYQLEVASEWLKKHPIDGSSKAYVSTSQTTKVRRFHTPAIVKLLTKLEGALKKQEGCRANAMRQVFARFAEGGDVWGRAVRCVATLDALTSLATVSARPAFCRPQLVTSSSCTSRGKDGGGSRKSTAVSTTDGAAMQDDADAVGESAVFAVCKGCHPCLVLPPGQEPIPNDLQLGGDGHEKETPRLLLLTGPNMGGKSTLLRQTCLVSILAQVGCFVPAESLRLSPVDRVFTRLGASDRILAGQSTFFVELSEASTVLHHATKHSLVILDELGRGTSTFDGTALAHAVVHHLATVVQCRCLFATHYHSLVEEWGSESRGGSGGGRGLVALGHMACIVDDSDDGDDVGGGGGASTALTSSSSSSSSSTAAAAAAATASTTKNITFLYNLTAGSSPRSFGINVAKLAKLPEAVLKLAAAKSSAFEKSLLASTQWQDAVALGKRFLKAVTPPLGNESGCEVLEAWLAAQRLGTIGAAP